jgi:hypothetical protein
VPKLRLGCLQNNKRNAWVSQSGDGPYFAFFPPQFVVAHVARKANINGV